jgi:hypothetical protein
MIILSIYALVVAGALTTSNSRVANSYLNEYPGLSHQYNQAVKDARGTVGALVIAGVVLTVGAVIFQIWVIIVANKARKEIN